MKPMVVVIPYVEFDICSYELGYVSWSHNKKIYKSRMVEVILRDW